MKKLKKLQLQFQPQSYELRFEPSGTQASLLILGNKVDRPSHRITLHQKKLKISAAKINRKDKKGVVEFSVDRINHLNSFEEARLHTKETLYPGQYEILLEYQLPALQYTAMTPSREIMPSIDEPEAWAKAQFKQ